jgi:Host cell surface-exposed lipoprotein
MTNIPNETQKAGSNPVTERPFYKKKRWIAAGIIVLLYAVSNGSKTGTTGTTSEPTTTISQSLPDTTEASTPTTAAGPVETAGQRNARLSAEQYLSMGNGFSRVGLIGQLSSSYGEGFSVADATYGVDATHTDWNAQACLSAKGYLQTSPFSHSGLVEQLSSSAGEQFTVSQAEYGATCAGI